jgi:hypothetical protein
VSQPYVPRRRPGALVARDGELVVWPAGALAPAHIAGVESLIYQIIDGVADVDTLVEDVCAAIDGIPPDVARARISEALDSFECDGLLDTVADERPHRDLIFPYSTST